MDSRSYLAAMTDGYLLYSHKDFMIVVDGIFGHMGFGKGDVQFSIDSNVVQISSEILDNAETDYDKEADQISIHYDGNGIRLTVEGGYNKESFTPEGSEK